MKASTSGKEKLQIQIFHETEKLGKILKMDFKCNHLMKGVEWL